jgi:hypothetical protein
MAFYQLLTLLCFWLFLWKRFLYVNDKNETKISECLL